MKTFVRSLLVLVATLAGTALFANTAKADHFDYRYTRLDRLAQRLESESRTLYFELRRHSFGDAELRMALREVGQISREASHIHSIIHSGASLDYLHADVTSLQALIHHVEEHTAHVSHFADHVARMDALTHAMDDCLHDLADDHVYRRRIEYRPVVVDPYRGGGIAVGGSGFSIRIGR